MHVTTSPAILYFGTPVILISTVNEDGNSNLAPISSAFWLGWHCVIGLASTSMTSHNLTRSRECVLNLVSVNEVAAVNRLALTTGVNPVPARKRRMGYWHIADKFTHAKLTPIAAETVTPPRVRQCPVHLEAVLVASHPMGRDNAQLHGAFIAYELHIRRVHIHAGILRDDNHVDPDRWRPLIMSFQRFYGLGEQVHESRLSSIGENLYETSDIVRTQ